MLRPSSRPASQPLQGPLTLLKTSMVALLVAALVRPPPAHASPPELVARLTLAAQGPRIAVVVVSQDLRASLQQGALEGAAEAALTRSARFTVVPVHHAFNPSASQTQQAKLEEAREKMKSGRQALDELDNVKATEDFSKALEALLSTDLSQNFSALLEAWTMRAAGHVTGGENGPAKKDIEAVVSLAPKAEFTPNFFPPDLIKFAEAQRKFAANAKGELLVRTEPPGARVWVDGTYRGVSPVTVAGLTDAKHFIAAAQGGYALAQRQAGLGDEVFSLDAAELGPGWKKATSDIKKDPEGPTRDSAAQALGKTAQLDQVLLVVSKKSLAGEQLELIGLRLEVRDGHNASFRAATVNPNDPEQLAIFFDALTGKDAKRDGRDAVHHFKGAGNSSLRRTAGITLLGVGAAGLVMGGVFGILAANQANTFRSTAQTAISISDKARVDGQTYAAVADVSYIIGLLAGGTGGVLLLTDKFGGGGEGAAPTEEKSGKGSPEDLKRRELDRKAAEERRAAEERAKEDEGRREDERKREEIRKQDNSSKAAEDKRRAEQEETTRKVDEDEKKAGEAQNDTKLSKKEREALERRKREEEKQAGKLTRKQQKEEDQRKKKEAEARLKEDARLKAEAEAAAVAKKKDEEERKKKEEAERRKAEDHDDLRNY